MDKMEQLRLIESIKWVPIDRDNMEFRATISTYQLEALTEMVEAAKDKVKLGGASLTKPNA